MIGSGNSNTSGDDDWRSSSSPQVADPGIICFQHCGPKVFCIDFPERCPSCTGALGTTANFKLMPFRLPFPFVKASQYPGSVILRPTVGDFLKWERCVLNLRINCYILLLLLPPPQWLHEQQRPPHWRDNLQRCDCRVWSTWTAPTLEQGGAEHMGAKFTSRTSPRSVVRSLGLRIRRGTYVTESGWTARN